jgi:hypothetical protein
LLSQEGLNLCAILFQCLTSHLLEASRSPSRHLSINTPEVREQEKYQKNIVVACLSAIRI